MSKQDELLNLLVQEKLINNEQLVSAEKDVNIYKRDIEEVLVEKKIISPEKLVEIKSKIFNLPYENLAGKKIEDGALKIIPIEVAENYKIICFEAVGKKIKVGVIDPNNFKAIEAVDFLAKEESLHVEYYLISDLSFNIAFKQYKTLKKEISSALKTRADEKAEESAKKKKKDEIALEEVTKTAPVAKIVSVMIRHAVDGRASDIHIEPMPKESRVRYRIDGILGTSLILPKNVHNAVVGRVKVLANMKLDETRLPQDGRIRMTVNEKEIDLRVSTLPLVGEEKVVMRILEVSKKIPTLKDLGFIGTGLKVMLNNINKTEGMFLVTGPTGSGKSTTLFSILNKINKEEVNIVTLEDPVEYHVEGVNQSQVKPEIGYSFATGLRSLLRQDPDIVMVGEIRDNETAELAVHAGLTGHFVLSTLHTGDAISAIPRLMDMNVEPFLLGSTLNTVVSQRLVRKICPHCIIEDDLPSDTREGIKKEISKIPLEVIKKVLPEFNPNKIIFYKGKGCSHCGKSGYNERAVVAEVIDINEKIKEIIINEKRVINLKDILDSQKFITIKQDAILKVLKGITTVEEYLRIIFD